MKNLIAFFVLMFSVLSLANAQNKFSDNIHSKISKDSLEDDYFYDDSIPSAFHISFDLGYGFNTADSKAIFGDFNNMGSWNIFLNFGNYKMTNREYYEKSTGLEHYTFFVFGLQTGNAATEISLPSATDKKISMSIFRTTPKFFMAQGFGSEKLRIIPYTILPFFGFYTTNRIAYRNIPQNLSTEDRNFLNNYIDRINFGSIRESGVMFHIGRKFNIYFSYENLISYPRLLMGKDIGMTFIDLISSGLLYAGTINLIGTKAGNLSKPTLMSTIVNFVLQNAYMVTTQYLRRDNMNWPFKSSKSIMTESFRLNFGYIL